MKRIVLVALLVLALWPRPAVLMAQQVVDIQQVSGRIAGSIFVGGNSMAYLKVLADQFGGRLTGSSAYNMSAAWAAAQFRAMGIRNIKMETFTITHGWERGRARATLLTPLKRPLVLEPLGWTPSTPAKGIKGEVVLLEEITPEKIKEEAAEIKGHIVMIDLKKVFAGGFLDAFGEFMASFQRLKEAGAVAVLLPDSTPNNVLNAFSPMWGTEVPGLPVAQVGREDAQFMERHIERNEGVSEDNPLEIEFEYQNKVTGPVEVSNVVAEIQGREQPDEWVIVGAHLDSWDYGTGAQDNGSGCAMVLESARAISESGRAPRRSIRFALWGGEEQGLLGSTAYVRAHAAELNKCVAVLNTDNGAGHPRGWKVEGRADLADALKPISESLLAALSGNGISQETSFDTDHGAFMLQGIPALDLWVDMTHYGEVHHKSSDTIDKVDAHNLAAGAAIVAITAYAIADNPSPIAPKLEHEAVAEIIRKAKLENFLKNLGLWK
ncbi:MAG TPA: M20/M25/M40 family metallo-hydrolase [Pyrinomonadaceae bacterium]